MTKFCVRRVVELDEEHGGPYRQFIGVIDENDVPLAADPSPEERVRSIVEEAYDQSTVQNVHRHDKHLVGKIECERSIETLITEEDD